jgi:lipoprotein-releasing system permease protein
VNVASFVARRYLLSRRKKNFINIISLLSLAGVAFSTAALIIVLSVFNGLQELLRSLNNSFDPEIKITATLGKSFEVNKDLVARIGQAEGVDLVTEVIEDYAYVRYRDANQVVMLKGVSDNFLEHQRIDSKIVAGKLKLREADTPFALVGRGIQYNLSVAVEEPMYPLQVYYITQTRTTADPTRMYKQRNIAPGGVFSIVQNFDDNYIIVPLDFAQELLDYGNKRTSFEIKVKEGYTLEEVQQRLSQSLGDSFQVLNPEQQHKDLYRLLRMEKLFTFLAFAMLLGISAINIFFSLMMLAIDKKKDISVLTAMGATPALIRSIFITEGAYIAFAGAALGMGLGVLLCLLQQQFGLVSMGMETAVTQGYPVKLNPADLFFTMLTVAGITLLISFRPAVVASRFYSVQHL